MVQRAKPVRSCWNACIVDKISNEFHMCVCMCDSLVWVFICVFFHFVYAFLLVPVSVYRWTDLRNTHTHTIICTLNIGAIKFKNREVNLKNGPSSAADRLRQFKCTLDAIFRANLSIVFVFLSFWCGHTLCTITCMSVRVQMVYLLLIHLVSTSPSFAHFVFISFFWRFVCVCRFHSFI